MPHRRSPFFKKHNPERAPRPEGSGRYDAPADGPIEIAGAALERPFAFDRATARRLIRRDVNAKEAFTLRDASGVFWRAAVSELSESGGQATPYERMDVSPEPSIELTLACAVLARQRMLFVAQKATELGAARIVPLLTEHSVPPNGLEHEKAHAWPGQIVRAAKQCRRASLPELAPPTTLEAFLSSSIMASAELRLCLDNVGAESPVPGLSPKRVVLLVGPEGGFSDAERTLMRGKAAQWLLGGRVLRAETAVLVGLSAVHLQWGDFRPVQKA
ncbi:MAG: 16S rRNA (uracil(1498)-N(3))-methyltransferase [Elusimicrobia bacterium]|nr:16S rRNA (uracil(1498)-N(3))-methyltransferase [Elusimicrobiota bacterium]